MQIRSFLAFDIPDGVKKKLGALVSDFQQKAPQVKWTRPENMHVTLKFFGNLEEDILLKEVPGVLDKGLKDQRAVVLKCQGVGVFPNWKYPKVIWAGFTGDVDETLELQKRIEEILTHLPIGRDKRAFRLHLTIGRARSLGPAGNLVHLVEELGPIEFGKVVIDHVTVYKSVLTKAGPIYTPLHAVNFEK